MINKNKIINIINGVKIVVSPWDQGFTCGIVLDSDNTDKMSDEEFNLCSTIARGMIKQAVQDPHTTYLIGLRGFSEDAKKTKPNGKGLEEISNFKKENVIDFFEYLKAKTNKEIN